MAVISGKVWDGDGFREGYVVIEDGIVVETGDGTPQDSEKAGWIVPVLTDAHTHVGDAGLVLDRRYSLEELVAPPAGLKHRHLSETPDDVIESDMRSYASELVSGGVGRFLDFREGGVEGAAMLRRASGKAVIFGRPTSPEFDANEMDALLDIADGIGISSVSDVDRRYIESIADAVRRRGKHLALHVSERIREDIDFVMSLEPDLVIHMCEATDADLRRCADADVPVAVCAGSNLYFGKTPPLKRMADAGVEVSIGTDNAMLAPPDIFAEAKVFDAVAMAQGCPPGMTTRALVRNGSKLLRGNAIGVAKGQADPVVTGPDPLSGRIS